ncbi:peptidoglycan DD-metalloendopeptidase family protein [Ectobacillus sp. JY-23]|uniref:peptidoglycan DD-metalloendopeptidase family protein n=1 Tax=Ectobacillus sp. JY-23 TaxID=2933872 RepID=UPI0034A00433
MRDGEKKSRKVVKFGQKRWVFPTVYIACAAVILTATLWYQSADKKETKKPTAPYSQNNEGAVPVTKATEVVKMPVAKVENAVVKKKFYDPTATPEEQEAALVFYNNTYSANTGIDIASKDGKTFDVTAAISGTVVKSEKDSLLGYVVTVDSGNGITASYQSLEGVALKAGDKVAQGDVIGKAGLSTISKEAGYHVHFELRKDGVAVNPQTFFDKTVADIKTAPVTAPVKNEDKEPAKDEKQNADKEEPAKDEKQNTDTEKEPAKDEKQNTEKEPAKEGTEKPNQEENN